MTYNERLQLFVDASKSIHLEKIKQEIQERYARLEAIYNQAASGGIAARFLKMMERPLQPHDDEEEEEEALVDGDGSVGGDDSHVQMMMMIMMIVMVY